MLIGVGFVGSGIAYKIENYDKEKICLPIGLSILGISIIIFIIGILTNFIQISILY